MNGYQVVAQGNPHDGMVWWRVQYPVTGKLSQIKFATAKGAQHLMDALVRSYR